MADKPVINHNVYVLGAGFSADGGVPVVKDFLERMADSVDWLSSRGRETEAQAVRRVFEFRLRAAGAAYRAQINIEDIEELFSLASASQGEILTDDVTRAIAATIDFCRATAPTPTCSVKTKVADPKKLSSGWFFRDINRSVYELYAEILSASSNDCTNSVITFNYDTLLEDALFNLKIPFHYGLSNEAADYGDSAQCVCDANGRSVLGIFKLHGSVNWGTPRRTEGKIQIHGGYGDVLALDERALLIPPTWRKVFAGHVTDVWARAVQALNSATRIIIIGFSLPPTDVHFKYLLAAGLQGNISLRKLLFVNPGLGHETERGKLRGNLFSILRQELEEREIIKLIQDTTAEFLLNGNNLAMLRRNVCANYQKVSFGGKEFALTDI